MNKNQLVDAVARRLGDKRVAAASVEAVLDTVMRTVTAGEKVALSGFGVFEKADRAARSARNPATGATVELAATSVPRFRAGQLFKGVVSGQRALPPEPEPVPAEPSQAGTAAADTGGPVRRRTRVAQDASATSRTEPTGGGEAAEGTAGSTGSRGSEDARAGGEKAGRAATTDAKPDGRAGKPSETASQGGGEGEGKAGKPSAKEASKGGKRAAKKDSKDGKQATKKDKDGKGGKQAVKKDSKGGKQGATKDSKDGAKGKRSGRKG